MRTLRHFLSAHGARIWGRYGFCDAFSEARQWYAGTYLAIDQGPIIVMLENYRSSLLWRLFMSCPEVCAGLHHLGFTSPHLAALPASLNLPAFGGRLRLGGASGV